MLYGKTLCWSKACHQAGEHVSPQDGDTPVGPQPHAGTLEPSAYGNTYTITLVPLPQYQSQ